MQPQGKKILLTSWPPFGVAVMALLEDSLHVAGSCAVLQASRRWQMRPARLPTFTRPLAAMVVLTAAHWAVVAQGWLLHHLLNASATAPAVCKNLVVLVSLPAASKQVLHTAQGVGLHLPMLEQKSAPPLQ